VLAVTFESAEKFDSIRIAVAIRVAKAIKPRWRNGPLSGHGVEIAPDPGETVDAAKRKGKRAGGRDSTDFARKREAIERAILIRREEPAVSIWSKRDPRAVGLARDGIDLLDGEPRRSLGRD
jgi:hypothetical protein